MRQKILSILLLITFPYVLLAHGSHGNGVFAGFTHPILGVDHNVAILGTGILGYFLNQKKWYLAPLAFIIAMIVGGVFGMNHEATPLIEKIIAFSVLTIGFMATFHAKISVMPALLVLAIFGAFHGYAHGAEMSEDNTLLKYVTGYTFGALLIAVVGTFFGKLLYSQDDKFSLVALVGGIIIGCGLMMLIS